MLSTGTNVYGGYIFRQLQGLGEVNWGDNIASIDGRKEKMN